MKLNGYTSFEGADYGPDDEVPAALAKVLQDPASHPGSDVHPLLAADEAPDPEPKKTRSRKAD